MRAFLNLSLLLAYGALAGTIAVYGPRWTPMLDQSMALALGVVVLLGCGLLHEIYARMGREIDLRHELAAIGYDYNAQEEENEWLRREVETLREGLLEVQGSASSQHGGRTVDEVMAEVKVLKSVIQRLTRNQDDASDDEAEIDTTQVGGATSGDLPSGFMPPVAANVDDEATLKIVRGALRDDRIDLVLQPIVSLPQRRRRAYECFSRLRTKDGGMILPEQYIGLAERSGLITAIDNMLLFRCVQLVRRIQKRSESIDFFCNISPHTLADKDFFGDFVDFLESNRDLAGHLVFEFGQSDFARWSEAGAKLLDRLAILGCRFSLDSVHNLDFDAAKLAARHVAFVKVEGSLLLQQVDGSLGMLRALRRHQIDLIVTKVEEENALIELLDFEVDFGQGFLFGEPRLARPAAPSSAASSPAVSSPAVTNTAA